MNEYKREFELFRGCYWNASPRKCLKNDSWRISAIFLEISQISKSLRDFRILLNRFPIFTVAMFPIMLFSSMFNLLGGGDLFLKGGNIFHERNFATNSNYLIPISLKLNGINLISNLCFFLVHRINRLKISKIDDIGIHRYRD